MNPPFRFSFSYQLDFLTPGISPLYANSLKQIRQIPNFFITECGRPHLLQRVYSCTLNFLGLLCFTTILFLANFIPPFAYFLKGKPNPFNKSNASSFVSAVVTKTMSIPRTFTTSSKTISGNIVCSFIPRV